MIERVKQALEKVRPYLSGADVALMDVKDGVVKIKLLLSSCGGTMSDDMLLEIVEDILMAELPEIKEVKAV